MWFHSAHVENLIRNLYLCTASTRYKRRAKHFIQSKRDNFAYIFSMVTWLIRGNFLSTVRVPWFPRSVHRKYINVILLPQSRYIILVLYTGNVSESWENEVRPLRTNQPRSHYIDAWRVRVSISVLVCILTHGDFHPEGSHGGCRKE